ncbi:hypothetical protein TW78_16130 [Vibrio coralliilyticus]|jgi:hypothetical protein|uniref:Uncharacterized protein n=1 Tax=Vibrio coralliilyticus TaxID=190893 RepID=A0A097QK57_9VIBR|nr:MULTISPECIES: hypothetical protein [Vibrio]AIU66845.1 hypothetical protein JV59_31345 [Vibrio coralliilyticus]AIW18833.1 hypothetical protein IX92_07145 [Vibrio coralliilyticus]ARC93438.1 hypothetical protein B6A42_08950 [Vibrio coralliilyticus]EEX31075.1 hypothetical protein VIC_004020 [Vibrio coralliilyticus ATCC BAA-450]KFI10307.1 hypothetical protein IX95_19745 [Vibrio sp. B183]
MALSSQEIDLIEQLLHVRKRKEERLQAQWNQLNEQQDKCKHEKQRSYQEWLISREALTNPLQTEDVMDRSQLNQLLGEKRSQYIEERSKADSVEDWHKRIEQLEREKSELWSQKTKLIRGQEKLKEVLDE